MNLEQIQNLTLYFSNAHKQLVEEVTELNDELEAVKRKRLSKIRMAVAAVAEEHAKLKAAIETSPALFVKPRTITVHGVKVGFQKGKGGIEFNDADAVVARIEKLFESDAAEVLIHTKKTPNKDALAELPVADLKRIGCNVIEAGDQVVIKPTDSDVDKIVNALLKDATKEAA